MSVIKIFNEQFIVRQIDRPGVKDILLMKVQKKYFHANEMSH